MYTLLEEFSFPSPLIRDLPTKKFPQNGPSLALLVIFIFRKLSSAMAASCTFHSKIPGMLREMDATTAFTGINLSKCLPM